MEVWHFHLAHIIWGVVVIAGLFLMIRGKAAGQCPDCGAPYPFFRVPANKRQAREGGWTCKKCGCEIDRFHKKVKTR